MTTVPDRIVSLIRGFKAPAALVTLAANLVPAVCVLLFGWNAGILILLYWAENVIIGLFLALKIATVGVSEGPSGFLTFLFTLPFFIVHYGGFCLGHLAFALFFLVYERGGGAPSADIEPILRNLWPFLAAQSGFVVSLGVIGLLQAADFGRWLINRGWGGADPQKLMVEPYGRIIALHVTLIATGFVLVFFGSPRFGVVLLALFKTAFEGAMAGRKADKTSTVSQTAS